MPLGAARQALIGPAEAHDRFPLMAPDGVRGALWLPTDGWLDPSGLALALAAGARRGGVEIRQHARVVGIGVERAHGIEEVTVRPIPELLAKAGPYSGAILRSDGSLRLARSIVASSAYAVRKITGVP